MRERCEQVVVLTTRTDAGTRAIAGALADRLETGATGKPIAIPIDAERARASDLDTADVVLALDPLALERARDANVGLRLALWTGLGDAWPGTVEGAHAVLLPHESSVALALARGARRADVAVVGPIAPEGFGAAVERTTALAELLRGARDVPRDAQVLVIPFATLSAADLSATLTQLALVKHALLVVFDVEDDLDAARSIRVVAPRFGLTAALVSDREYARAVYGAADRVVVRLEGPETPAALASGAPLVVIRPKNAEVARALAGSGLAAVAETVSMLAVTLDAALTPSALERGRGAVAALDIASSIARVEVAIEAARARHPRPATGLPRGVELLARDPGEATMRELAPLLDAATRKRSAEDAAIDAELAELKKRIGG
jgi:hypothetical protein